MSTDITEIINGVLAREGWPKYTNAPADRGGPTKGGITLASWREFMNNRWLTASDVAAITKSEARSFYRHRHVTAPKFDQIEDPALMELVIDAGVHHGRRLASKWLQRAVGAEQDGVVGPITLFGANAADPVRVYLLIVSYRIRLFGRLVSRDPELKRAKKAGFDLQAEWASGWNNRAASFLKSMAESIED